MERPRRSRSAGSSASSYWGQGYAAEAARAVARLRPGASSKLPELVAFTCARQPALARASWQKLGMTLDPQDDFEDPTVPVGHWQRPHVIYRIANPSR